MDGTTPLLTGPPEPSYGNQPLHDDHPPKYQDQIQTLNVPFIQDGVDDVEHESDGYDIGDLFTLSKHVKVTAEEVFVEPDGSAMNPAVKKVNDAIFEHSQVILYNFVAILFGGFLSLFWGLLFALMNFVLVYVWQPFAKFAFIAIRMVAVVYRASVRSFVDPVFQAISHTWSNINGRFKLNIRGVTRV